MNASQDVHSLLLDTLTNSQKDAVSSTKKRQLIVAGAGSGKTEVMARRVAWWIAVHNIPKDSIVAFTFTERAAEEMKFRIRQHIQRVTRTGEDATLGGMYVGTIHGFCLKALRELWPDDYHNYDVIDEGGRLALVQRSYHGILGLSQLQGVLGAGQFATIEKFLRAYDLLNEYDELDLILPGSPIPADVSGEAAWCKGAQLKTKVGGEDAAKAFALSAGRYYAYLRCRRFLDFSTSQSELLRMFRRDPNRLKSLHARVTHLVVDEVQDINPVQRTVIDSILGKSGTLTAVGDHRQAIFGWRGGRVDIMDSLFEELKGKPDAEIIELAENFRSTPRIIKVANDWAKTIGVLPSMSNLDMLHGRKERKDFHSAHVAVAAFADRDAEARWIGERIKDLVRPNKTGASHDSKQTERGLAYSDVVILIRSSTDARTYMKELERQEMPAVFRAGPDLFSQPEILLFVASLARMAGISQFLGGPYNSKSLPNRIQQTLGCGADPESVIRAACRFLRREGLPLDADVEQRLLLATDLLSRRIAGENTSRPATLGKLHTPKLIELLQQTRTVRRVFPQTLFHLVLAEAGISGWDSISARAASAMFHLGALSSLVKGIETPGWTSASDFKYQVIALCLWGTENARTEEAPLLVPPDAVTISTIHSAKGLEYAAVFLADVCSRRFPSQFARRMVSLPFDGAILKRINPAHLADNANYDAERRLMYVALTRAERYLFVTYSKKASDFFQKVETVVRSAGGKTGTPARNAPRPLRYLKSELKRDIRLVTSFSDLRYYLECPHDFYLRKVLGFAPTIDQAFGYGRGVHNIMRAIHSHPAKWAKLAADSAALKSKLEELVEGGLFYLRYTTGEPLERMREKAIRIISDYVKTYAGELAQLEFEPEREFETLIQEEQVLVSGAIDVIRLDDPPRVTLIDFKSGEPDSDNSTKLDEEEMRLQVSLYGMAAKRELEYQPERGLVRYLGESDREHRELVVDFDAAAFSRAREVVLRTARQIRDRQFRIGPQRKPRNSKLPVRCAECDFREFCGQKEAKEFRTSRHYKNPA